MAEPRTTTKRGEFVSPFTNLCDAHSHSVAVITHHTVTVRMPSTYWSGPENLEELRAEVERITAECVEDCGRLVWSDEWHAADAGAVAVANAD